MNSSARVSVLMPVRNARDTVACAVESILVQDFADLELVLVDDGSTDGTSDVLAALAAQDRRIRVTKTEPVGIIEALNLGISLCRGEFIARMDADDVSHPARIRLQVEMMEREPELSVCGCLVRFFPRKTLLGGLRAI
jgi:glycosyltransferase involved in cell wall biosynthesis